MSRPIEGWELSAYVDGDLSPRRMAEIDAEAARSPELGRQLEEMLADHRALQALGAADRVPVDALPPRLERLTATLDERLGLSAGRVAEGRRSGGVTSGSWRHVAVLGAGAAFGWAAASWAAPSIDPLSAFIDEAAEIHRVADMAPAFSHEVSANMIEGLGTLFAHRIDPPDLAAAGFSLSHVDVAATDSGPVAVLYYVDPEARRVSLVLSLDSPILDAIGPDIPGRSTAPRVTTHDGLAVSFGQGDGIAYALVGSVPEPRARQLATWVAASLLH